jgi:hypothetical protein
MISTEVAHKLSTLVYDAQKRRLENSGWIPSLHEKRFTDIDNSIV